MSQPENPSKSSATREIMGSLAERVVPKGTTRHGLVIGIDKYAAERLILRYAVADARALYDLMVDAECGRFPRENVQLLLDEDATTRAVRRALSHLSRQAGDGDMVWIYYAGHASLQNDQAYWVTYDA